MSDDRRKQDERDPGKDQVAVLEGQQRDEEQTALDAEDRRPELAAAHYAEVIGLASATFRGAEVQQSEGLSEDEQVAFRLLAESVRGDDLRTDKPLLAEERLAALNLALALLQPTLALGLAPELAALRGGYDALVANVTELRDRLEQLGGAQEAIGAADQEEALAEGADEDDPDEDDPDEEEKPEGKPDLWAKRHKGKPKSPPRPKPPGEPARATLTGAPDDPAVEPPVRPSTLSGKPDDPAVERPVVPSTLVGQPGDRPVDKPAQPSTAWDGPGRGERR